MSPTERAIRQFRQRYPLITEGDRYSDRLEMAIRYDDLKALYAAPEQQARIVAPPSPPPPPPSAIPLSPPPPGKSGRATGMIEQPAESANPLPRLSAGGEDVGSVGGDYAFSMHRSPDPIARANLALNAGIWCNGIVLVVLALREVL